MHHLYIITDVLGLLPLVTIYLYEMLRLLCKLLHIFRPYTLSRQRHDVTRMVLLLYRHQKRGGLRNDHCLTPWHAENSYYVFHFARLYTSLLIPDGISGNSHSRDACISYTIKLFLSTTNLQAASLAVLRSSGVLKDVQV